MNCSGTSKGWIVRVLLALAAVASGCGSQAGSQFPTGPLTMIIPYGAGSGSDVVARGLAQVTEKHLGQPIVILNKEGGGGAIGFNEALAAKPDGYTVASMPSTIAALKMQGQSQYNHRDVEILCVYQDDASVVFQSAERPWKDVKEAVAFARQNPGKLKIGTPSKGSLYHLLGVLFSKSLGIETTIIPIPEGIGQAVLRAVAGDIDVVIGEPAAGKAQVDAGGVRVVATIGDQRLEEYPNVPTLKELGYEMPVLRTARTVFVRKGTPEPVVAKLREVFSKAAQDPEYISFLKQRHSVPFFLPADKAVAFYDEMEKLYREALTSAGLLK